MPSGTLLTFLGGGLVGMAVNLLSTATLHGTDVPLRWVLIDSLLWLAAGGSAVWLGLIVSEAELSVASQQTSALSADERRKAIRARLRQSQRAARTAAAFGVMTFAVAAVFTVVTYLSTERSSVPSSRFREDTQSSQCPVCCCTPESTPN